MLRCHQMVRENRNSRTKGPAHDILTSSKHPAHLRHVGMTLAKRAPVPSLPLGRRGPSSRPRNTGTRRCRGSVPSMSLTCYDMAFLSRKDDAQSEATVGTRPASKKAGASLAHSGHLAFQMRSETSRRGCLRQRQRRLDARTPARGARWLDTASSEARTWPSR